MHLAALALSTLVSGAADATVHDVRPPLLVVHGSSARPWSFMADPERVAHIDGLPFRGFAYNLPMTWLTMSDEYGLFSEAQIHEQFGGLDDTFANLVENMVSVVIRRRGATPEDGDFFDDAAWSDTVEQFRRLARVAATPRYQCVGIVFDNEEYFEPVWDYPDDVAYADLHALDAYRDQARERGREVMQAILDEWPACRIIVMHGPYRSAPEPRPYEVSMDQVGGAELYELDAPFFMGMAEVAGPKQVVDGGEVYQLRSRRDFAINTSWRRFEMGASSVVPAELAGIWPSQVGVTHGLYNLTWPTPEDPMTPAIMRIALEQALRQGDPDTWIFTESAETWLDPGGMPDDWRSAVLAATAAASVPECGGDVNGDGAVTFEDLTAVLGAWGGAGYGPADRDLDGQVGLPDLLEILATWGPCGT